MPDLKNQAEWLFQAYLETFQNAPEAAYLLKRYFFTIYFEKKYLQDNIFFIPRADFLWFFTYYLNADQEERTIELKKRSTSKAETEVEHVTIQIRQISTVGQGPVAVIYTRTFEDGAGEAFTLKNTVGAVALAKKLIADFTDDRVTGAGNY